MDRPATILGVWLTLGLLTASPGCGYAPGFRSPPGVRSIAVPFFSNQTFPLRREVEYQLTDELRKEIQARTDLRLVDAAEADMAVYGTIRDFKERLISEGRVAQKIESTIVIEVEVIVEDYVHAKQWRENVTEREPLSVEAGETLEHATRIAVGKLAKKILEQIESWEEGA